MRMREARVLLEAKEWSGAYYLAGYAVECGLKACITRNFGRYRMPDKDLVKDSHVHDLEKLVRLAELNGQRQALEASDPAFAVNWATVKDWNESSRYNEWTEAEAKDLYKAINQRTHGVLQWVRKHW
ncbi:HEPN domain-containing protein [Microbispora sp. RL4-1S]|uniref:HEPN domain-containing protein n=1 Tax=Microbispora oryzae TaxID=2806554 RepID=A0A940WM82_9ACTN|nr:HEPN domain-containing protein [Microbispora oryzae]MBP2708215.1 HEPN domain-containing protein [Microbispora oryzae]